MTTGDEATTMDAYEVEKEYWDDGPEIEAVNIHYLWTPVGEDPEWETHRVTRFMPPSRAEGAGRRHRSRMTRSGRPVRTARRAAWPSAAVSTRNPPCSR